MIEIRFKYPYFKLQNQLFPTVRGKSWIMKVMPDSLVKIIEEAPRKHKISYGVVLSVELKRIDDLSLSFLKVDGGYSDFSVKDHETFIELLNSFRRFHKIESGSEHVTVIWILRAGTTMAGIT